MTQQVLTEFHHSEKIIYCTGNYINLAQPHIRQIEYFDYLSIALPLQSTHEIIQKIPTDIIPPLYEYKTFYEETALAYKNKILTLICKHKRRESFFLIMKFDSNFKLLSKYYIIALKIDHALKLLNAEIRGLNFNFQTVFNKYQTKLPYNIKKDDPFSSDVEISDMCHDQYEDTLVLTFSDGEEDDELNRIEVWQKTDKWAMIRQSNQLNIAEEIKKLTIGMMNILDVVIMHLECSRKHIVLELAIGDLAHTHHCVVLLDKFTFDLKSFFPGCQPTFYDDYDEWLKSSLELLSILPFRLPLLKIILSYF
jgi:hypothetical protein